MMKNRGALGSAVLATVGAAVLISSASAVAETHPHPAQVRSRHASAMEARAERRTNHSARETFRHARLAEVAHATAQATTSNSDCGAAKPSGTWTAISSYSTLQKDIAAGSGTQHYYLTTSISDSSPAVSGGLAAGTIVLDLNGCNLSITAPGNSKAAITLGNLTVEDTSANQDGTLTATGGNSSDGNAGAGAGIGSSGTASAPSSSTNSTTGGTLIVDSGNVIATGGQVSSSATANGGAGAGVGGGGGYANQGGAVGATVTVNGGSLTAQGGSTTGSTADKGGGAAGIGGGGGGTDAGGNGVSVTVTGGTVDAQGGSTSSSGTDSADAGSGIGGAGGVNAGGSTGSLTATGGSTTVSSGLINGAESNGVDWQASGFGPGGGNTPAPAAGTITVPSGTATLAGEYDGVITVQANATLETGAGASMFDDSDVYEHSSAVTDTVNGTLLVPNFDQLTLADTAFDLNANEEIDGALTVGDGSLNLAAGTTTNMFTEFGRFTVAEAATVNVPSGATLEVLDGYQYGTINLGGTLTSPPGYGGTLINNGSIVPGSAASIPGNGQGGGNTLDITINNYLVQYGVPSGSTAPPSVYVFAPTLAAGGASLPNEPTVAGNTAAGWVSGSTQVTNATPLSPLANSKGVVPVTATYTATPSGGGTGTTPTTITTPTSSANPVTSGVSDTLTTTVAGPSGSGTVNGGYVVFLLNGTTSVCFAQVVAGDAVCQIPSLPVGSDQITAVYEGNATYAASSTSGALTLTVKASNAAAISSVSTNLRAATMRVALRLPDAGSVRVSAFAGSRSIASRQVESTATKASRVIVTLKLSALRHDAHAAPRVISVRLKITFTPKGGSTRTIIKTVRVRLG